MEQERSLFQLSTTSTSEGEYGDEAGEYSGQHRNDDDDGQRSVPTFHNFDIYQMDLDVNAADATDTSSSDAETVVFHGDGSASSVFLENFDDGDAEDDVAERRKQRADRVIATTTTTTTNP